MSYLFDLIEMLIGMNFIVAFTAQDDEIEFFIRSTLLMMFQVMQFQNTWIFSRPSLARPTT